MPLLLQWPLFFAVVADALLLLRSCNVNRSTFALARSDLERPVQMLISNIDLDSIQYLSH